MIILVLQSHVVITTDCVFSMFTYTKFDLLMLAMFPSLPSFHAGLNSQHQSLLKYDIVEGTKPVA